MKKYPKPKLFDPSEEEIVAAAKRLVKSSISKSSKNHFLNMRKAKQFLQNIMLIAESTEKIKAIVDQYEPELDDDKLTVPHLKYIIAELKIIISLDKKNNTPNQNDIDCLEKLEKLLKAKQ